MYVCASVPQQVFRSEDNLVELGFLFSPLCGFQGWDSSSGLHSKYFLLAVLIILLALTCSFDSFSVRKFSMKL